MESHANTEYKENKNEKLSIATYTSPRNGMIRNLKSALNDKKTTNIILQEQLLQERKKYGGLIIDLMDEIRTKSNKIIQISNKASQLQIKLDEQNIQFVDHSIQAFHFKSVTDDQIMITQKCNNLKKKCQQMKLPIMTLKSIFKEEMIFFSKNCLALKKIIQAINQRNRKSLNSSVMEKHSIARDYQLHTETFKTTLDDLNELCTSQNTIIVQLTQRLKTNKIKYQQKPAREEINSCKNKVQHARQNLNQMRDDMKIFQTDWFKYCRNVEHEFYDTIKQVMLKSPKYKKPEQKDVQLSEDMKFYQAQYQSQQIRFNKLEEKLQHQYENTSTTEVTKSASESLTEKNISLEEENSNTQKELQEARESIVNYKHELQQKQRQSLIQSQKTENELHETRKTIEELSSNNMTLQQQMQNMMIAFDTKTSQTAAEYEQQIQTLQHQMSTNEQQQIQKIKSDHTKSIVNTQKQLTEARELIVKCKEEVQHLDNQTQKKHRELIIQSEKTSNELQETKQTVKELLSNNMMLQKQMKNMTHEFDTKLSKTTVQYEQQIQTLEKQMLTTEQTKSSMIEHYKENKKYYTTDAKDYEYEIQQQLSVIESREQIIEDMKENVIKLKQEILQYTQKILTKDSHLQKEKRVTEQQTKIIEKQTSQIMQMHQNPSSINTIRLQKENEQLSNDNEIMKQTLDLSFKQLNEKHMEFNELQTNNKQMVQHIKEIQLEKKQSFNILNMSIKNLQTKNTYKETLIRALQMKQNCMQATNDELNEKITQIEGLINKEQITIDTEHLRQVIYESNEDKIEYYDTEEEQEYDESSNVSSATAIDHIKYDNNNNLLRARKTIFTKSPETAISNSKRAMEFHSNLKQMIHTKKQSEYEIQKYMRNSGSIMSSKGYNQAIDTNGNTFLHKAIKSGKTQLSTDLIIRNSSTDIKNSDGNTATHLLCSRLNSHPKYKKLLKHFIKVNCNFRVVNANNKTPLDMIEHPQMYKEVQGILRDSRNNANTEYAKRHLKKLIVKARLVKKRNSKKINKKEMQKEIMYDI